jgi:hypothetical protein
MDKINDWEEVPIDDWQEVAANPSTEQPSSLKQIFLI